MLFMYEVMGKITYYIVTIIQYVSSYLNLLDYNPVVVASLVHCAALN